MNNIVPLKIDLLMLLGPLTGIVFGWILWKKDKNWILPLVIFTLSTTWFYWINIPLNISELPKIERHELWRRYAYHSSISSKLRLIPLALFLFFFKKDLFLPKNISLFFIIFILFFHFNFKLIENMLWVLILFTLLSSKKILNKDALFHFFIFLIISSTIISFFQFQEIIVNPAYHKILLGNFDGFFPRASGIFGSPFGIGVFSSLTPLFFNLFKQKKTWKPLYLIINFFSYFLILTSMSRIGYFSWLFLTTFSIFYFKENRLLRILTPLLFVIFFEIIYFLPNNSFFQENPNPNIAEKISAIQHHKIFKTYEIIREEPTAYQKVNDRSFSDRTNEYKAELSNTNKYFYGKIFGVSNATMAADSSYLSLYKTTGLTGLILILIFCFSHLRANFNVSFIIPLFLFLTLGTVNNLFFSSGFLCVLYLVNQTLKE